MAQKHPFYTLKECLEERGKELDGNNQDIVKYLCGLQEERNNLAIIIEKQYLERKNIESEIEKLTYKLCLINKSLSQRIKAKNNYDKTIQEIEANYDQLVEGSNVLKKMLEKQHNELDDLMNKKIGTGDNANEELRTIYARTPPTAGSTTEATDLDECECVKLVPPSNKVSTLKTPKIAKMAQDEPTKENGEHRKSPSSAGRDYEFVVKQHSPIKPPASTSRVKSGSIDRGASSSIGSARNFSDSGAEVVRGMDSDINPSSLSSNTSETKRGRVRSGSKTSSQIYKTDSQKNMRTVSYSRTADAEESAQETKDEEQEEEEDEENPGSETHMSEYSTVSDEHIEKPIEKTISTDEPPRLRSESEAKMWRTYMDKQQGVYNPKVYKDVGEIKSENLNTLREIELRSVETVEHPPEQLLAEERRKRKERIEAQTKEVLQLMADGLHVLKQDEEEQHHEEGTDDTNEKRESFMGSNKSHDSSRKGKHGHHIDPTDLMLLPKIKEKVEQRISIISQEKETRKSVDLPLPATPQPKHSRRKDKGLDNDPEYLLGKDFGI